jgi:hypothetical protein
MVLIGGSDLDDKTIPLQLFLEGTIDMNSLETISSDQKKFTFNFTFSGSESSYNIYINHTDQISDDFFIWDYFGSGELYCNFSNYNLVSWKNNFVKLFTGYFLTNKLTVPDKSGLNPYSFAISVPFNGRYVWALSIDLFFDYEKVKKDSSLCSYLTFQDANVSIVSKHYQFGNVIDNFPSCSHPNLSSSTKHSSCPFFSATSNCSLYASSSKTISSSSVSLDNTSEEIIFTLNYSLSDSFSHLFEIKNSTQNAVVNTLRYSSDIPYEQLETEALDIFSSYIHSYDGSNCTISDKEVILQDTNKDTTKVSYITSLIGV